MPEREKERARAEPRGTFVCKTGKHLISLFTFLHKCRLLLAYYSFIYFERSTAICN